MVKRIVKRGQRARGRYFLAERRFQSVGASLMRRNRDGETLILIALRPLSVSNAQNDPAFQQQGEVNARAGQVDGAVFFLPYQKIDLSRFSLNP